jgi:DNA modification methylase
VTPTKSSHSAPISVHPFPARMAPELAMRQVEELAYDSFVLDPMAGSGTTLRYAADAGHRAIGFDLDPLAVLMSRVLTTPLDTSELRSAGADLLIAASQYEGDRANADPKAAEFIEYWFGAEQRDDLARIANTVRPVEGPIGDALRLALSRIIVTKDRGASLARDVSHSRPHKVKDDSDYDVMVGFARSIEQIAKKLDSHPPRGNVSVGIGDARNLPVGDGTVDAVITSPPYLNAIDYVRGHRLALVWLGFSLNELRAIRSSSIGAERGMDDPEMESEARQLASGMGDLAALPNRQQQMILRYALDIRSVVQEIARVLRPNGEATLVVGNSSLRGVYIANDAAILAAAEAANLQLLSRSERPLPPSRRYLPPPREQESSDLRNRMRAEVIVRLRRP